MPGNERRPTTSTVDTDSSNQSSQYIDASEFRPQIYNLNSRVAVLEERSMTHGKEISSLGTKFYSATCALILMLISLAGFLLKEKFYP